MCVLVVAIHVSILYASKPEYSIAAAVLVKEGPKMSPYLPTLATFSLASSSSPLFESHTLLGSTRTGDVQFLSSALILPPVK